MDRRYRIGAETVTTRVDSRQDGTVVSIDGRSLTVDLFHIDERYVTIRCGQITRRFLYARSGRHILVAADGRTIELIPADEDTDGVAGGAGFTPEIVAPMPGKVLEVLVAPGDAVEAGAPLLLLEAMKMEHTIRSTAAAIVSEVRTAADSMVGPGQTLIVLEAADASA